jgi:hypothetical protein
MTDQATTTIADLKVLAGTLMRQSMMLQLAVGELEPGSEALQPTAAWVRFDPTRDTSADAIEKLSAYHTMMPAMEFGYDWREPVLASAAWVPRDASEGGPEAGYRVRIEEPAASEWLTIEFLVDPAVAKEFGMVAFSMVAESLPMIEMPGTLRIYLKDGTWADLPLPIARIGTDPTTITDATRIPEQTRLAADPTQPYRYILHLPNLPLDFTILEAMIYPAALPVSNE